MTILLMNVLVDTKLITKETLILKTLLIIVCVYILETIYFKDILCCWNIMCVIIIYNTLFLVVLSIYFQFSLYHIIQIYKIVINTHINMKKRVSIIQNPFINLQFGFGVYIPDWILNCFKHSIHVIIVQIITDKIKWLFCQWKWFVMILIKYSISSYTTCTIYNTNPVH